MTTQPEQASPRPWHHERSQGRRLLRGPNDEYIGSVDYAQGTEARDANAELIVTAVNAHEQLLAEVKRLREAVEYAITELKWIVHGEARRGGRYEEALNKLTSALASGVEEKGLEQIHPTHMINSSEHRIYICKNCLKAVPELKQRCTKTHQFWPQHQTDTCWECDYSEYESIHQGASEPQEKK